AALFAAARARALEVRQVVVPLAPGLFSPFGLLYSDVQHHYVRTYRRRTRDVDLDALDHLWRDMEAEARHQLAAEGFTGAAARIRRWADLRYHGQSFELPLPLDPPRIAPRRLAPPAQTLRPR